MYEDHKMKFGASNLWELGMVPNEIEEWIHEIQGSKKGVKKTRHAKP
jgi:hypothetical protein